ncbi:MAG: four-carbon acid sugar kinase family protein [Actinomycetota bacterium]|nr:four-carbon acid sugar kinase family protein [Actinomycetota bacterium]
MVDAASIRARVRDARRASGAWLVALDDDPTGSQSVHGLDLVTVFEPAEYEAALGRDVGACFVLTNTRSLTEADAVAVNERVADQLHTLAADRGRRPDLVSRGDSTLRGHVIAEVDALDRAHRRVHGAGYDGVVFAPAFFDAGRTTVDDVHRVRLDGRDVPAAETEYARDATFGFRSSNLREFLAEKSGGRVRADDVASVSLDDIRLGGVDRVAAILAGLRDGRFVVVNAEHDADYDVVALAMVEAAARGARLLTRAAPSFVRALAGTDPIEPLGPTDLWRPDGRSDHGLVVVGSHVSGTTRQVRALLDGRPVEHLELDVARVLDAATRDDHVADLARRCRDALAGTEVVITTSRTVATGADADDSLAIARTVSRAVTEVTGEVVAGAAPAWVVAKGGITSHDVAVSALGIRRAEVVGQMGRGIISVLRPVVADEAAVGMPYVVFAGNVGTDTALLDVVDTLASTP